MDHDPYTCEVIECGECMDLTCCDCGGVLADLPPGDGQQCGTCTEHEAHDTDYL